MNEVSTAELVPYLIALTVLVVSSAFFSGTEVAMFSLRRVDREQLLRSRRPGDRRLFQLLSKPGRLIATILIGNESVNVAVSVLVAGLCQRYYAGHRTEVELAVMAVLVALPLLLVFGEMTPKTVAFKAAPGWARRAASPIWLFGLLVAPVRVVVHFVADLVVRPFGGLSRRAMPPDVSEAEFRALVDAGSAEGQVDAHEQQLIHRVFEFGDKTVADAMVPRRNVFALSYALPAARLVEQVAENGYSRVPIFHRSLDNVCGILYAKELVIQGFGLTAPRRLSDLLHEPLFVVQTMALERLLRIFKQRQTHMALVVNEYGKVSGLVTMEDLLEELFGEIRDERESQKKAAPVLRFPSVRTPTEYDPRKGEGDG